MSHELATYFNAMIDGVKMGKKSKRKWSNGEVGGETMWMRINDEHGIAQYM